MIISLTGTPGTGKSVVAPLIAKKLHLETIELHDLAKRKNCFCGVDRARKTKIVDTLLLKREIEKMKRKSLLLVGHYSQDMKSDLTIVLRCEIGELRKRLKKRGWIKSKIDENIQAEIFNVCGEDARDRGNKVIEVNTSGKKAEKTAHEIISIIRSR